MRRFVLLLVLIVAAGLCVAAVSATVGSSSKGAAGPAPTTTTRATAGTRGQTSPKRPEMAKDLSVFPFFGSSAQWHALVRLAKAGGARIISTNINWASVEPARGSFSPQWQLDTSFVHYVHSLGLELRIQLTGMPDWARDPGSPSSAQEPWLAPSSPRELQLWAQFVGQVTRHFRGDVSYYEIWNEPNISVFFQPFPEPAAYARLLEASYLAIKHADSAAQVIFAGPAQNDVGFVEQTYLALDRLYPHSAKRYHHFFDLLGAHPYDGWRSPLVDSARYEFQDSFGLMDMNFPGFELLHQVMARNGEGYKKMYISEFGQTISRVRDRVRARYLEQAFSIARSTGYVVAFSWYCFYPTPANGVGWALLQGSYPDWHETLTYKAWRAEPG